MRIHFWGVRGSLPTPATPDAVETRIAAAVQRITPRDIVDQHSRERFIASLPKWISTVLGGNTACVEIETSSGDIIIFDAGSGIRELGLDLERRQGYGKKPQTYHIFFSHFHWDHVQGLPFFNPAFNPNNTIIFYATRKNFKQFLTDQMQYPYFPITMLGEKGFNAHVEFRYLDPEQTEVNINNTRVTWHRVRHPGGCTAYCVSENGKKMIFSTDTELRPQDFEKNPHNTAFYTDTQVFIIDAQYTLSDSIQREGWGHSTFSVAIDFAIQWNIKKIILFHHEPTYSDKKIYSLKEHAKYYREYTGYNDIEILLAQEGLEITL